MGNYSTNKREIIRDYFECLKKRNTTTDAFAKLVIADLIAHWKEKRPPKEGLVAYILAGALLLSLAISPILTFLLIVGVFFLAKMRVQPNIRPKVSDEQIDEWLSQDRRELFNKSPEILDVIILNNRENIPASSDLLNLVMNEIFLSSGYAESNDNLIDSQDYFCEKGLDGRIRHSIHIFMVIYLCKNFLTYYKCYWNFIKGVATLVETGEYLYDMIVSVKTKELSSASLLTGEGQKLILREELILGTTDGKEIYFPAITEIRISYEKDSINKISTVDHAVNVIRRLLRERRIDMQIIKSFDADD